MDNKEGTEAKTCFIEQCKKINTLLAEAGLLTDKILGIVPVNTKPEQGPTAGLCDNLNFEIEMATCSARGIRNQLQEIVGLF